MKKTAYRLGSINLASSADPTKLSATVSSIIIGLGGMITIVLSYFGYTILPAQLESLAQLVGVTVGLGASFVSLIGTIWGLIRKVLATKE